MTFRNQSVIPSLSHTIASIHACLTTDDLHKTLRTALEVQEIGTGFTLFFVKRSKLQGVYTSICKPKEAETLFDALSPLAETLYRDQYCGLIPPSHALLPKRTLPSVVAAATLTFLDDPYGLLVVHGEKPCIEARKESAAFDAICCAVACEFVKIQVKEMAEHDARIASTKLSTITKVNDFLVHLDMESLLAKLMEISMGVVSAQVGSLLLVAEDGSLKARVDFGLPEDVVLGMKTTDGKKVVDVVLASRRPFYVEDGLSKSGVTCKASKFRIESFIAMPLSASNGAIGIIFAVNLPEPINEEDQAVLATICGITATAIENALLLEQRVTRERLLEQIQIAQDIQTSLSPKSTLNVPGLDLSAWSVPADETGGDCFDFFELPDNCLGLFVGDASGHGLGAALVTLSARSSLLTLVNLGMDIEKSFGILNDRVADDCDDHHFVTLFYVLVDREKEQLTYVSAGHGGQLWYQRATDSFTKLDSTGLPLGMFKGVSFERSKPISLTDGDIFLFGTDGIWEAQNNSGVFFGFERMENVVRQHALSSAAEISKALHDEIMGFMEGLPLQDDVTAIVAKIVPKTIPEIAEKEMNAQT